MSGTEFHKLWHLLNEATGCVIDARQALQEDVAKARLRRALEETRRAEREILRLLGAGEK